MVEVPEENLEEIRKLYPAFTDDQLREAQTAFRRYVEVMTRIYNRVYEEQGPEAARKLAHGEIGE